MPAMARERREAELARWVRALPDEVVRTRPVLAVAFVGTLAQVSDFATVGRAARRRRGAAAPATAAPGRSGRRPAWSWWTRTATGRSPRPSGCTGRRWRCTTATSAPPWPRRGRRWRWLRRATTWCEPAPVRWPGSRPGPRATSPARTRRTPSPSRGCANAGFLADVLGCSITLGDLCLVQGRLGEARRTFEAGLDLGARTPLRGTADMHVGWPGSCSNATTSPAPPSTWRPRSASASTTACRRTRTGRGWCWPGSARSRAISTRRSTCSSRPSGSTTATTPRTYDPSRRCGPGCTCAAASWTSRPRGRASSELAADDELSYLREYEHSPSLGSCSPSATTRDLDRPRCERLLDAAEQGGRTGTVIAVLVLLALAHGRPGRAPSERAAPRRRARPSRRATSASSPTKGRRWPRSPRRPGRGARYVRRLRAAATRPPAPPSGGLLEPLQPRELDVLRLLASDLDGPDIARQLSVAEHPAHAQPQHLPQAGGHE